MGESAFLVELKTDMGSRREGQHEYLSRARDRGLACILSEFKEIAMASKSRIKYFHLLRALLEMGLLTLPKELKDKMLRMETRGSTKLIGEIDVSRSADAQIEVVFVQPRKYQSDGQRGFRYIYFDEFAYSIEQLGELGYLVAQYLRRWKEDPGMSPPKKS